MAGLAGAMAQPRYNNPAPAQQPPRLAQAAGTPVNPGQPPAGTSAPATAATQPAPNPLQPVYTPNAPLGQATLSGAQTSLTPQQLAALGPQATLQQIMAGFAPAAAQSQSALNNQLAASGIVGGGATDATQNLQGQLASALGPTLANAIQGSQSNVLGAEEFGLQGGLQQALANMGASNNMTDFNISNILGVNSQNAGAANNAGNSLAQMLMGGWNTQMGGLESLLGGGLSGANNLGSQIGGTFVNPSGSNWLQQILGGLGI